MATGPEQLRDWMRRRGFTQADAARYLEWPESYLSKVLSSQHGLGLNSAVKVEQLTGIPVEAWVRELDESESVVEAGASKRRLAK